MSNSNLSFESTGLLPAVVAENVLRQLSIADETLIDYIERKTENVYRNNPGFRQSLTSGDPRACYRMWVEHWITGEHHRREKQRAIVFTTTQEQQR